MLGLPHPIWSNGRNLCHMEFVWNHPGGASRNLQRPKGRLPEAFEGNERCVKCSHDYLLRAIPGEVNFEEAQFGIVHFGISAEFCSKIDCEFIPA